MALCPHAANVPSSFTIRYALPALQTKELVCRKANEL